jgi:hypothetical protein
MSIRKRQLVPEIIKGFQVTEGKIDQILLLIERKFDRESYYLYSLLTQLEPKLLEYTTIVMTNFSDFQDQQKCEEEVNHLKSVNRNDPQLVKIINSDKFIFVNNSPISFETDEEKEQIEEEIEKREDREFSRRVVFSHLRKSCQETYHLRNIDNVAQIINDFFEISLESNSDKLANDLIEKSKRETREMQKKIEEMERILKPNRQSKTQKAQEAGLGGLIVFFVFIIVAIGIIGYWWSTRKKKNSSNEYS